MERKENRFIADAADITPRTQDCGIPTMGELIDGLFAGFAPLARAINADAKEGRASSC